MLFPADLLGSDLAKLLMESSQEIPDCLERFKPPMNTEAPLFEDDDDDDEDEDSCAALVHPESLAQGAAWDAGDNAVVFQGDGLRNPSQSPSFPPNLSALSVFRLTRGDLLASNEGSWGP